MELSSLDYSVDGPIARVFPGWTLAVGNGYIFPDPRKGRPRGPCRRGCVASGCQEDS